MEIENLEQILTMRKEIEVDLLEMLDAVESEFDLDDIKDIIYNEQDSDDMMDIVRIFDNGNTSELSNVLELVSDAWNYFPHKSLGGLSPAERALAYKPKISREPGLPKKDFPPRSEIEMAEVFGTMLSLEVAGVGNADKDDWDKPEIMKLSEKGKLELFKLDLIHKIFRRWSQTTWGDTDWSTNFSGETPRQELAKKYPAMADGERLATVGLVQDAGDVLLKPVGFSNGKDAENFLLYNINQILLSKSGSSVPDLDAGFKDFFAWLVGLENEAKKIGLELPKDPRAKYLGLFWGQAGGNLVFNISLELSVTEKRALSLQIQDILTEYLYEQGQSNDDFLITDRLFERLWGAFRKTDKKLLGFDEMADPEYLEDLVGYSSNVFYELGVVFDRYILFPLDAYFGAVEVIWQEHESFFNCLLQTITTLNGTETPFSRVPKEDFFKKNEKFVLNPALMWFAPPSYFRLFPWAREILKV